MHGYYMKFKYITYPWHWHSNSKFVQSCRLNWLSSQTNLTSSTTSWIIYEDNKPTFAIYFIMNNINLRPIQFLKLGIVYFFSLPTARKWKWGAARYFINPLLRLNHIVLCNSCMHETCHQNIQITLLKKSLLPESRTDSHLRISSVVLFFIMSAWKITLLQLLRVIFWYLFKKKNIRLQHVQGNF